MTPLCEKTLQEFGEDFLRLFRQLLSNLKQEEVALSHGNEELFHVVLEERLCILHVFEKCNDEFVLQAVEQHPETEEMTLVEKLQYYKNQAALDDSLLLQKLLDLIEQVVRINGQLKRQMQDSPNPFAYKEKENLYKQVLPKQKELVKVAVAVLELEQED